MNPWENEYSPASKPKEKIKWILKKSGKLARDWDTNLIRLIVNFFKKLKL